MGLCFRKKTDWKMMNCGLVPIEPILKSAGENSEEQHSYELYAQLVAGTTLEGAGGPRTGIWPRRWELAFC